MASIYLPRNPRPRPIANPASQAFDSNLSHLLRIHRATGLRTLSHQHLAATVTRPRGQLTRAGAAVDIRETESIVLTNRIRPTFLRVVGLESSKASTGEVSTGVTPAETYLCQTPALGKSTGLLWLSEMRVRTQPHVRYKARWLNRGAFTRLLKESLVAGKKSLGEPLRATTQ